MRKIKLGRCHTASAQLYFMPVNGGVSSSNRRRSANHQAIARGAGQLAIGANRSAVDREFSGEGSAQFRVKRLLNLLVVAVHREGEEAKDAEAGIQDVQHQLAVASARGNGGIGNTDVYATPIDVRSHFQIVAIDTDTNILRS